MSDAELKEIARGHFRLEDDAKIITIYSEVLLRGHRFPDFLLYLNSMEKQNAPNKKT
jgi:hypothetical protein